MREIKFRAWIYGLGKMMPVKEIDFDDFMPSVMVEINSERHEQMFFENTDYPDCELMQYTGLKDKNGKEIYEGDIVLCKIHDKEYMGLVEYTNTYGFYYLSGMGRSDTELWGCNERKVIGNIYENPEMLT